MTIPPLQIFLIMLLMTVLLVSVAQHERRSLQARLRDYARRLTEAEDTARRNAAQDLHDGIGQMLVAIRLKIENLRRLPANTIGDELTDAAKLLNETQQNTRGLLAELSPPGLYELGLASALNALGHRLHEQHRLHVQTHYSGSTDTLPMDRRIVAYRIARELLLNVVRHAKVDHANLQVDANPDRILISVIDQGQGFDPDPFRLAYWSDSFGLFGIRDRVAIEGGHFELDTAPGRGCRVSVTLPTIPLRTRES